MEWDGVDRRGSQEGREHSSTVLARIDERVKNMNEKLTVHMSSFEDHRKEDDKNFAGLYRWVFIGVGVLGCLQFVILASHH